ncbi:MAG TPA: long-chain fatty acid--CoA ligase [Candidatus Krumholzibacteria bacterium]|nr:long-chain fatty acid--CoA ligase [Candidatus Krumholzibacteria bacterium]
MQNVALAILEAAARRPDATAMRFRRGDSVHELTYGGMSARIEGLARALVGLGVQAGDRVGIFSPNLPEWLLVDYAVMSVRAVTVPIYATSTPAQARQIIEDSGMVLLFAGTATERDAALEATAGVPGVRRIVTLDPQLADEPGRTTALASLEDGPAPGGAADEVMLRRVQADSEDLAALIYTSGTTGEPKGVMLRHRNFTNQYATIDARFTVGPADRSLCFLPLSHVYERTWSAYVFLKGASNTILANPRDVVTALGEARPTVMVSAPRLYEKVHAAVHAKVETAPPLRRRLFHWAVGVGQRWWRTEAEGRRPDLGLRLAHAAADRLVLRRIRDAVGGPKNFFSSGGAALAREVEEFFMAAGLLVCQGYGLTETAPMLTCNAPGAFRFGSVGRPVEGVELRIGDEGEILARGPNVTEGYFNNPSATAEAFTDGWFRTGDVGYLDEDGYLVITDRIKDLIITAGGKNVAPQRIEAIVGKDLYIDQLAVVGDRRSAIGAIVVPAFESLAEFARERKLAFADHEELIRLPEVVELYRRRIADQCASLAPFEKIRRFTLVARQFSMQAGEITPTLKVRRKVIAERYRELIERMYGSPDSPAGDA